MKMTKLLAVLVVLALAASALAGCGQKASNDDNALTILVSYTACEDIMKHLIAQFPDIDFVAEEYAGQNMSRYLKSRLYRGEAGDIFFYTTFLNDDDVANHLLDLSGYEFLTNYDKGILSTLDVNGAIYQVPGPISVRFLGVNKTLFEEHGWKIPNNFYELVAVCSQIAEEAPDITPLAYPMKNKGLLFTPVTTFAQMGALDTLQGKKDEEAYRMGTESFGAAFGEGLDMLAQLIDAHAFQPEKYSDYSAIRANVLGDREAAMCFVTSLNAAYTDLFTGNARNNPDCGTYVEDEYIALPVFGANETNKGLSLGTSNTWGINKRLGEKGNEKKLENALRVLEWLSTEEAQLLIRGNNSMIPVARNLSSDAIPDYMKTIWNDPSVSVKKFFIYTGYEHIMVETANVVEKAIYAGSSEGMKEEFIKLADDLNREFLSGTEETSTIGVIEDDISVEQTRTITCEAMRNAKGTDIAIASEAGRKNTVFNKHGLAGSLFKGRLFADSMTMLIANDDYIVTLELSGAQIKELLQNGKEMQDEDGNTETFDYWSNCKQVRDKEGKITSLLLNGVELDDNARYSVSMLEKDIVDQLAKAHEITGTDIALTTMLEDYFRTHDTIRPEK